MSAKIRTKRTTVVDREPSGLLSGELAINLADTPPTLFTGTAASAVRVGPVVVTSGGAATTPPASPKPGTIWVNDTDGVAQVWMNGAWVSIAGPSGMLLHNTYDLLADQDGSGRIDIPLEVGFDYELTVKGAYQATADSRIVMELSNTGGSSYRTNDFDGIETGGSPSPGSSEATTSSAFVSGPGFLTGDVFNDQSRPVIADVKIHLHDNAALKTCYQCTVHHARSAGGGMYDSWNINAWAKTGTVDNSIRVRWINGNTFLGGTLDLYRRRR